MEWMEIQVSSFKTKKTFLLVLTRYTITRTPENPSWRYVEEAEDNFISKSREMILPEDIAHKLRLSSHFVV